MFKKIIKYFSERKNYNDAMKLTNYQIATKTQELFELEVENKKLEKEVLEKTKDMYRAFNVENTQEMVDILHELMSEVKNSNFLDDFNKEVSTND